MHLLSNFFPFRFIRLLSLFFICVSLSACGSPFVLTIFDLIDITAGNKNIAKANTPSPLTSSAVSYELPESYDFEDQPRSTTNFLKKTGTAGLLVVHQGEIVYEDYNHGKNQNSRFLLWSVSKSVTSALVGIAIEEGHINSVTDPVTDYVPELATTAYANTTIEDSLEMASGVKFNETYLPGTDVFFLQLTLGGSFDKEVQKYQDLDYTPGTFNQYKSLDTVVLGMVLEAATGESIALYLESRIWEPAGMTNDAVWLADDDGLEAAYCCLKATVRDQAKFGLIYLNNGFYNGSQIIPQQWILDSLDNSKPHLQPGENPFSEWDWGYGYQWWMRDTNNDYSAIGVFNQFVYVNPDADLVIVKASGNPTYLNNDRENEHIALFRRISDDFISP